MQTKNHNGKRVTVGIAVVIERYNKLRRTMNCTRDYPSMKVKYMVGLEQSIFRKSPLLKQVKGYHFTSIQMSQYTFTVNLLDDQYRTQNIKFGKELTPELSEPNSKSMYTSR